MRAFVILAGVTVGVILSVRCSSPGGSGASIVEDERVGNEVKVEETDDPGSWCRDADCREVRDAEDAVAHPRPAGQPARVYQQ